MDEQELFSALSNPTRRAILRWMKEAPAHFKIATGSASGGAPGSTPGEVCVSAIQQKTGLSQSTVSAYMAALQRAGLVQARRRGQWTFYRRDEAAIAAFAEALKQEL